MKHQRTVILIIAMVTLLAGATTFVIASRKRKAHPVAPPTRQDESIAFHQQRIATQPDDSEAYRMYAAALMQRAEATGNAADYDSAWAQLDHADQLEPGSLRLLQARSVLSMSRHRFQMAQTFAEQGLRAEPRNTDFLGLAGDGALERGDLDAADRYYRQLVEVAPRLPSAWARASHLAEVRGDLAEAIRLMEKSIDASYPKPLSRNGFAWSRAIIGEIQAKRGNLEEAQRQYKWALAKYTDHPLALEFMADLDQWQGHNDEAESIYRKLLAFKTDPKFQISLATLLEKRGEKDEAARLRAEARAFYEQAVASGNEGYLRPLATLDLASGNYQRAAELAARDLALRPTTESRAIYANILKAANEAGQPLTVAQKF